MKIRLFTTCSELSESHSVEVDLPVRPNRDDMIIVHDEMFVATDVILDGGDIFVNTRNQRPVELLRSLGFQPSTNVFDFKTRE